MPTRSGAVTNPASSLDAHRFVPIHLNTARAIFETAETLFAQNRIRQALRYYRLALRCGFNNGAGVFRRWLCYMKLGQFEGAWRETDVTERQRKAIGQSQDTFPLHLRRVWNGAPFHGKRVLVRCYHGLGDAIQFVRYAPLLKHIAHTVTVQCEQYLMPLLASTAGIDFFIPLESQPDPASFDLDVELMELPYAFRTALHTIPSRTPYLSIPTPDIERTRNQLLDSGLDSRCLNIGICWASGGWNPSRDLAPNDLAPLTDISHVKFLSLQKGPAAQELASAAPCSYFAPITISWDTLSSTAAIISSMDLVISVDTMVAHLAGALAKPVWTLLPFNADWRWMVDTDRSPWYPTMQLFRQSKPGDWLSVTEQIAQRLSALARLGSPNSNTFPPKPCYTRNFTAST